MDALAGNAMADGSLLRLARTTLAACVFAWLFVGGRVAHGLVQILTTNIRLRGLVFTVNFLATLGLWALVLLRAG